MNHPASCPNPDDCTLSYRDHLAGFGVSCMATPNRGLNKSPGQPDETALQATIREKRWDRDMAAFRRLHKDGLTPPQINGSAFRERHGKTDYDITDRHVTIDWNDPS